jgi:predicted TIM-barrel fold metal-dependent hydrolase
MARFKGGHGRVVWMPTFDAENQVRVAKEKRPFVSVASGGALLPEALEVLRIMGKEKLALATGHSSPAETLLLIRAARESGVTRIVVTHATKPPVSMSVQQQKEAARLGAWLEFDYGHLLPPAGAGRRSFADFVRDIRAVGAEHCILSSDLGQADNPVHTVGWKTYLEGMQKAGLRPDEIDIMARRNPARLLGLE